MDKIINKRYHIIEKIGSGGMADVYLAHDTVLDRDVAIKMLRGDLVNNPVALLRFKREANAGSGLNHPNIVEVYDVGEEEGSRYIVMEYVKGPTAKELIFRRGSLELNEAVDFMLQLSYGIAKAHAQSIVHRDIKPQNILVKADGTLKVSDFGIAQAGEALQLTKVDSVMGSVHYLAPELVRGEGASVQSDIYAMGIIFYEILVGKPPFDGEMPVEIAMKQLKDPTPSVQEFNPSIPNSVVNIINKATSKNIANRYKNVDEMIADLQTVLSERRKDEVLWEPELSEDDGETKVIDILGDVDQEKKVKTKRKLNKKSKIFIAVAAVLLVVGIIFAINSSKPKVYVLEDLSGMSVDEAKEFLLPHNIHISSKYEYEFSDEFEKDIIIGTSPEVGATIDLGSQIQVILSKGKYFEIGDYVGEKISDVRKLLENSTNLSIRIIYEYQKDAVPGVILKQEGLQKGEKISPEQDIDIVFTVAKELEIQIPNLNNTNVEDAKKQLELQGIKVVLSKFDISKYTEFEISQLVFGVVIKTDPMMGSSYVQTETSVLTIYYYDKDDIPVFEPPVETETEE
ncbi:MAG: Stk1 family PASTA domain-containing Ser/Thr kinase [Erysipelothrix sp.]|nr:Stk1 family PASTA domain-containing Ser/Thr kinase [Erysipelothrix sp.]